MIQWLLLLDDTMAVNSWMITRLFWPDDTVAVNSWMILLWLLQLYDTVAVTVG